MACCTPKKLSIPGSCCLNIGSHGLAATLIQGSIAASPVIATANGTCAITCVCLPLTFIQHRQARLVAAVIFVVGGFFFGTLIGDWIASSFIRNTDESKSFAIAGTAGGVDAVIALIFFGIFSMLKKRGVCARNTAAVGTAPSSDEVGLGEVTVEVSA